MNSKDLFERLDAHLVDEEEGFLGKIRSLGFFDKDQFQEIVKLIRQIPLVADKDDCLRIKREHLHSFVSLLSVLIDGQTFIADSKVREEIEEGIGKISGAFIYAFFENPPKD